MPKIKNSSTKKSIGKSKRKSVGLTPAINIILKNKIDSKKNDIESERAIDIGIITLGMLTLFNMFLFLTREVVTDFIPRSKNLNGMKPAKKNKTQS